MKLNFNLLVIDDDTEVLNMNAFRELGDFLEERGFSLNSKRAEDISPDAIEALARQSGAEFDLVIIDYRLGDGQPDGSFAAQKLRQQLRYTDIIFYSSTPPKELLEALANQEVAGAFVANRTTDLGDVLVGVAETIIGKAVDLTHMRGIALAAVADMDVLIEDLLHRAFASEHDAIAPKATRTLLKLAEGGKDRLAQLQAHKEANEILVVVRSNLLFTLGDKYEALARVGDALGLKEQIVGLNFPNILKKRNLLAHARESAGQNGVPTLKSVNDGQEIEINDAWMTTLRTELRNHRVALDSVCNQIDAVIA